MNVVVLDPAEEEVLAIRDFHERIRPGLGAKFVDDFLASVARIRQFPRRYAIYSGVHRVCHCADSRSAFLLSRQPYLYRRGRRFAAQQTLLKRRLRY